MDEAHEHVGEPLLGRKLDVETPSRSTIRSDGCFPSRCLPTSTHGSASSCGTSKAGGPSSRTREDFDPRVFADWSRAGTARAILRPRGTRAARAVHGRQGRGGRGLEATSPTSFKGAPVARQASSPPGVSTLTLEDLLPVLQEGGDLEAALGGEVPQSAPVALDSRRMIWSLRHAVTSYDAWYVALAESLDCSLVTLDLRLAKASGPACAFLLPPSC